MELREYWRVLRRRVWIPISLVVVAAVAAGMLMLLTKPQYTASATIIAKAPSNGNTVSFTQIATSNSLAMRVKQRLNLQESVEQILGQITVSPSGNDLYKLSVTDANPARATDMANSAAEEAVALYQVRVAPTGTSITALDATRIDFRNRYMTAAQNLIQYQQSHPDTPAGSAQLMTLQLDVQAAADSYTRLDQAIAQLEIAQYTDPSTVLASVVDEAAPIPDATARLLRIAYAAGLAMVLGIGLILTLEYFDHSVRSPEEAEQLIGASVLGVIPRARLRALRTLRSAAE